MMAEGESPLGMQTATGQPGNTGIVAKTAMPVA
jgi:hypothetical protein